MKVCENHLKQITTPDFIIVATSYCRICRTEKQKIRRLKKVEAKPKNKFHPNQKNLKGRKYGALTVLSDYSKIRYNSRSQILWECLCDCGEKIKLPTDKLPHNTLAKKNSLPKYTCCETCRQKTCPLCFTKYDYRNSSKNCLSNACQEEMRKIYDQSSITKRKLRYGTDIEYRKKINEWNKSKYGLNADAILANRSLKFQNLSLVEKELFIRKQKEANRKSAGKRFLKEFLNQSNEIIKKLEK